MGYPGCHSLSNREDVMGNIAGGLPAWFVGPGTESLDWNVWFYETRHRFLAHGR